MRRRPASPPRGRRPVRAALTHFARALLPSQSEDIIAAEVAVVVATFGRAALLPRLIKSLEEQEGAPPYEVVIVDDASRDDTRSVLAGLAPRSPLRIRIVTLPRNSGPAAARNAGWRATRARLLAFTDDDCVPSSKWLAALVAGLRDADLVQGCTRADPRQAANLGPFSRTIDAPEMDGLFRTCNVGYRREWLERLGGFDPAFRTSAEDTDLARRAVEAGARSAFAPEALVHHDVRPSSWLAELRGTTRWDGIALVVRRHPELRSRLHHRIFWRRAHEPAALAMGALAVAGLARSRRTRLGALALAAPYVDFRLRRGPLPHAGALDRVRLLPAAFTVDAAEVLVLLAASARHRTIVV